MMRIALLTAAVLCLAPAPGNTGGCGADSTDEAADFVDFCLRSRSFACVRNEARGEEDDVQTCVDAALESCTAIGFWPATCEPPPRVREIDACINTLRRSDNLDLRLSEQAVEECRLCP